MPLLGSAAMLLSFDVDASAIEEHDRWHTHEHLPERLSIPGFLRGTRYVATGEGPRYMVLYEVRSLETLGSAAYLARLNDPTPWTRRVMPFYRGMRRGLCSVVGSFGRGQGGSACLVRFAVDAQDAERVQAWLLGDALAAVPATDGLCGAHLLRGAQAAAMTNEQRIRGADEGIDWAVIATGYDSRAVLSYATSVLGAPQLSRLGARDVSHAAYALHCSLARSEIDA